MPPTTCSTQRRLQVPSLWRCSLLPARCSLLPAPCSLLASTFRCSPARPPAPLFPRSHDWATVKQLGDRRESAQDAIAEEVAISDAYADAFDAGFNDDGFVSVCEQEQEQEQDQMSMGAAAEEGEDEDPLFMSMLRAADATHLAQEQAGRAAQLRLQQGRERVEREAEAQWEADMAEEEGQVQEDAALGLQAAIRGQQGRKAAEQRKVEVREAQWQYRMTCARNRELSFRSVHKT